MNEYDISFEIISTDVENDSILVRPWSSLYKNSPQDYPLYNIAISNLSTDKDINNQIARICIPIVRSTLLKESSAFDVLVGYLNENTNVIHTIASVSDLNETVVPPLTTLATEPLITATAPTTINFVS